MLPQPLPRAFDLLKRRRNVAVDAALLESLPQWEGVAQEAGLKLLTGRQHVPALTQVVGMYPQADEKLKPLIRKHAAQLSEGLRAAISSTEIADRLAAVALLADAGQAYLAYLLADALRGTCPTTRQHAAEALKRMTGRFLEQLDSPASGAGAGASSRSADALADALERAVNTWELHEQVEVLEAATWMADRLEAAIRRKVQDPHGTIVPALINILERYGQDVRAIGFVVRALGMPALREAAGKVISRTCEPASLLRLVDHVALLAEEEIWRGWRKIGDWRWVYHSRDALLRLAGEQADRAVRLIAAAGGAHEQKLQLYRDLLAGAADHMREAVIRQLGRDHSEAARQMLTELAGRTHDPLAPLASKILRGGTPEVQKSSLTPRTPVAKRTERPPVTLQDLRVGLAGGDALVRARCLQRIRESGHTKLVANEVYRLAHDPEPVVRSLAVAMLADLPGPTSERILRAALNDRDERVQANAIEVLDRLDVAARVDWTGSKLRSRSGRVRANAVRSLLRTELREAGETLLDMLEDESRTHRLSALWVVERMGLTSVIRRLEEMSGSDPDPQVRQRAARTIRTLLGGQVVSSWWHQVAEDEPPGRDEEQGA